MSTTFSKKMQGVGTRLLGKYGSTVTLVSIGQAVWDPILGEDVPGAEIRTLLTSVPVPVKTGLINGTTIQAGDMIVKSDFSVVPHMQDKIEFNGVQWSIVGIEPKIVNDDAVAYFIQIRGGSNG